MGIRNSQDDSRLFPIVLR